MGGLHAFAPAASRHTSPTRAASASRMNRGEWDGLEPAERASEPGPGTCSFRHLGGGGGCLGKGGKSCLAQAGEPPRTKKRSSFRSPGRNAGRCCPPGLVPSAAAAAALQPGPSLGRRRRLGAPRAALAWLDAAGGPLAPPRPAPAQRQCFGLRQSVSSSPPRELVPVERWGSLRRGRAGGLRPSRARCCAGCSSSRTRTLSLAPLSRSRAGRPRSPWWRRCHCSRSSPPCIASWPRLCR